MDSSNNLVDYDYVVADAQGIRKVKGGVEHLISREDWDRECERRLHKNSGCMQCSFITDIETFLLYTVPRDLKDNFTNRRRPHFLGFYTMTGWVGHSGFYLFMCHDCCAVRVDYPHGYTGGGCLYLRCEVCREKLVLDPRKDRAIYEREKAHVPKSTERERMQDLQDVITEVEKQGVRVIVTSSGDKKVAKVGFLQFLRQYFNF